MPAIDFLPTSSDICLLYFRFALTYRGVEDLLAECGLMISNGSIRRWVLKFGPIFAKNLRAIRTKAYTRWHLDEMMDSIAGRQMYMWRAVDSEAPTRQGRSGAAAQETDSTPGLCSDGDRH